MTKAEQGVNFQSKRVCVVGPFPPRAGELSAQVEQFCQLLHGEGAWVRRVNTDVRAVRRLPLIGIHLLPLVQLVLVMWRLIGAAPRSDFLHVFAASGWGFWLPVVLAMLAGRLYRRPVVISLCGGESGEFVRRSWRKVLPFLHRADAVTVTTDYLKEIVGRFGQKSSVVPNIVSLEHFPVLARTEWPPLVLWIGDLDESANPVMALRSLGALRKLVPEARLLMVGQGPLAQVVARAADELEIANSIAYRPELPAGRRAELLREASVLWFTALADNLPQVLLEAAASGTVIVSTDVGGIPELLHDGVDGLLVRPDDATRMAEATMRVLKRPFLAESLANNARLSVERYTWSKQRRSVARLYGLLDGDAPEAFAGDGADGRDDQADVLGRTEFLWSEPGAAAAKDAQPATRPRRR
ncbi:MAG: glycosyltransferase family 4 protein [Caldilineales bacterium]